MESTYAGKLGIHPEKVTRKLGVEVSLGAGCAEEGALDRKAALAEAERDAWKDCVRSGHGSCRLFPLEWNLRSIWFSDLVSR